MHFLSPAFLGIALLVPAVLLLRRRRGEPALDFGPGRLLAGLPTTLRVRLLPLPAVLRIAGLLLSIVALARPAETVAVAAEKEGIDILLGLDVSSSMAAKDLDPEKSRLELAREAARKFVAGRLDDRIGLLTFARYPDLCCPLTLDHEALAAFLKAIHRVKPDGPEDATGIGTAAARAAGILGANGRRTRVVILLTDGEENVATADRPEEIAPVHAGQLAATLGVRIYAIAIGLGRRDKKGDWRPIDTGPIEEMARRSGGRFFSAREAGAVEAVYRSIDELERAKAPEPRSRTEERFLPFLLAGLLLLALARILDATLFEVRP